VCEFTDQPIAKPVRAAEAEKKRSKRPVEEGEAV
jgi:hypothetical protein